MRKKSKVKVWLGQVKDVDKITRYIVDSEVKKIDNFKRHNRKYNVEGYELNGGRVGNGITKGAQARIDELNKKKKYNIIHNSDRDSDTQMQNLRNKNRNKNKT